MQATAGGGSKNALEPSAIGSERSDALDDNSERPPRDLARKLSEIRAHVSHLDLKCEAEPGGYVFSVDGKRVWHRPDDESMWLYLCGFRDASRYGSKFTRSFLERKIGAALKETIHDHGPIDDYRVPSATKRLVGKFKCLAASLLSHNGGKLDFTEEAAPRDASGREGE